MSKKPYKLKFLTKEKFLGKGYAKAKKWTLLANAGDKTMMRNAVTSAMGQFTSLKFNPAAKFADLILNGSYMGTYQISDQVEVRPHRVDITEQDYPLTSSSDITGGYLLEVDGFKDGNYFISNTYQAPIRIHYPEDEEIETKQTTYIRNYINNSFERALSASTFTDALKGYRAYVDTMSLIDWYISTEVSANIDGFYSTYFYKEKDDPRLYWGPLWDYDIAYNNDSRVRSEQGLSSSVNSLMADIAYNGSKRWVVRMWEDPWFQKKVCTRFQELIDSGLEEYMQAKVDSLQQLLSQSQQLNYQKWGINRRAYHEMVLYSSYDQYVSDLKTFISQRCEFLLQAFRERKPAEPTPPFVPQDSYYQILNARTNKPMSASNLLVVQKTQDNTDESQDWIIRKVGDYYHIINRDNGLALSDPTKGTVTPTTNLSTQLNTIQPDETDNSQLWDIVPQGTDGYYNFLNIRTQHIANLSGGNTADGTAIISYANDSKNSTSTNRLWYIHAHGALPPDDMNSIAQVQEPDDYALAYNAETKVLHFGSETPDALTFMVRIHSLGGQQIGTFRADEEYSMASHPSGVYIVSWKVGGNTRSAKFSR